MEVVGAGHCPVAAAPDWPAGIVLGLGGLAGGYIGARIQARLPDAVIRRLAAFLPWLSASSSCGWA